MRKSEAVKRSKETIRDRDYHTEYRRVTDGMTAPAAVGKLRRELLSFYAGIRKAFSVFFIYDILKNTSQ